MKEAFIGIEIVSASSRIHSGYAKAVFVTGVDGELEVQRGHVPLLTQIKAGHVRLINQDNEEEFFYTRGGILEVQPYVVTILADEVVRASDIDEFQAVEARKKAESALEKIDANTNYALALAELAESAARLRVVRSLKKGIK